MPQFELANFLPQLAWLALFFAILYFGIVRATLPRLGRTMTAREDKVTGDISAAERAKGEADALSESYAADIDAAHRDARAAIAEAKARASARVEAQVAKANAALAEKAADADAALSVARSKALGEIEAVAADAAADIVERLTGKRPAPAVVTDAARSAVAA